MSKNEIVKINNKFTNLELYVVSDEICPYFCNKFWQYIYKNFPKNIRKYCKKKNNASFDRNGYIVHLAIIFDIFKKIPSHEDHYKLIKAIMSGESNRYLRMIKYSLKLSRSSFMLFHDFGINKNTNSYISSKILENVFD
tara:strand:- start:180 stop:596 length:417 start_codon:yes stop_codon:yes gene_type:complete